MFDFFDFIVGIFTSIWNGISSTISNVVSLVSHIFNGFMFIGQAIADLPPFAHDILLTIVAISLVTMFISAFVKTA